MPVVDIYNRGKKVGTQLVDDPVSGFKTIITGQQLMNLIDSKNIEIWNDIEDLADSNVNAKKFVEMIGRRLNSPIDIESARMVTILNALEANTVATAADVIEIKKGLPY